MLYDNRWRSASDVDEAPQHFPEPKHCRKKVMVTVRWSAAGLVDHSLLNPGETFTAEKYCQQTDEMHRNLRRMCPKLVNMEEANCPPRQRFDRTFQRLWRDRSYTSWATKLSTKRHARRTSRPPTNTFSNTTIIFCARNASKTKKVPKPPSPTLSPPQSSGFLCDRQKQAYFSLAKTCRF